MGAVRHVQYMVEGCESCETCTYSTWWKVVRAVRHVHVQYMVEGCESCETCTRTVHGGRLWEL